MAKFGLVLPIFLICFLRLSICMEVLYAVNAGGDSHVDTNGVKFLRDPLMDSGIGFASDYGKRLLISRVHDDDQILYQTERYHQSSFGYQLPTKGSGRYVLVLLFSEVYFDGPQQKIFDVVINGRTVVQELDIFSQVGKGAAHHEYVVFTIENHQIIFENGQKTTINKENTLQLQFIKKAQDNPKINAFYLVKGDIKDVKTLPEHEIEEEMTEEVFEEEVIQPPKPVSDEKVKSGPRAPNPYDDDNTGILLPVVAALAIASLIAFCLCRM